jgi:hypothetical protein
MHIYPYSSLRATIFLLPLLPSDTSLMATKIRLSQQVIALLAYFGTSSLQQWRNPIKKKASVRSGTQFHIDGNQQNH